MSTILGFGVLLLAALNLSCSVAERDYSDCTTNYSVLEQAVLEIGDNRYNILKAFYSVDSNLPSVYVKITYESRDNKDENQIRLWTKSPIYLIIPAEIFQYASLLFNHHALNGLTKDLTVQLPSECCNRTSVGQCNSGCNNKYFDVLTNELYLYAQSNGKTSLTLDETSSNSIQFAKNCPNNIKPAAFFVFHLFCIILPFAFYVFISLIIQSIRPKIRQMMGPSTPRNSINQNYAALILIGLIFSAYVLICDCFTLKSTFVHDNKLKLQLDQYEEEAVHGFTAFSVIAIFVIDVVSFIISLTNIIVMLCLACYNNNERCKCCKYICVHIFFCVVLWKILGCKKRGDRYYMALREVVKEEANRADIESENTVWLLMMSFAAPTVCLGTHSGFIVIAWTSDPDAASSLMIFFVVSFLYYYFGFRQLYIILASRCKREGVRCNAEHKHCCCECFHAIDEADNELDEYHENLKTFNFMALGCAILPAFVFMGVHGLSIAAYVLLPSSLVTLPSSLFNILHWALILGSGLIVYRLLKFRPPYEETVAENIVKTYYTDSNITSKEYDKKLGQIVGNVLKKSCPPDPDPTSESTTTKQDSSPPLPDQHSHDSARETVPQQVSVEIES